MRFSREVKLGDYPFLLLMTQSPYCWSGESPDKVITVVAVEGSIGDWAAYFETPQSGKRVAENGDKLPKDTAEELFPEWAEKFTWRY